ncbi:PE family protein, partial [Mycobacterium bohemicum]|uniref:PE family protein n=1 Tax=Mycobacterium bohemicum TaxID=56425 RepID=UPI000A153C81
MSYVFVVPDVLAAAAADVVGIGSSLGVAHAVAAVPTTVIVAAGGDEVSAAIASLFSGAGRQFQALSARAAALNGEIVQALTGSGSAYAAAEAAMASQLGGSGGASAASASIPTFDQYWAYAVELASGPSPPPTSNSLATLLYEFNHTADLFGLPPLFYDGANGTAGSPNGGSGGLLWGNGGNGWNSSTPGVAGGNG